VLTRALAILTLTATQALAQGACMERAELVATLSDRYGESVTAAGLTSGSYVEIWAGPSGSWTFTMTSPAGVSCVIASGQSFEILNVAPSGDAL